MADYALTADPHVVVRTTDTASIPDDPANLDYVEYMAWCDAGNTPDPYVPPPPPVPTAVSRRQWYHQAATTGLITQDEALASNNEIPGSLTKYVNNVPAAQEFDVQMLLATAVSFDRGTPTCQAWIAALGWDEQTVETFWTAASSID